MATRASCIPLSLLPVLLLALAVAPLGVVANPWGPPNINNCGGSCCAPRSGSASNPPLYVPDKTAPLRTRLSASTAFSNPAYVAKYNAAYQALRKLRQTSPNDPRGWLQQANVHCAYCSAVYGLDLHRTWFFFPYHRWYLYFHEKILGELINDPTFTLPYWNWDEPAEQALPSVYTTQAALYDSSRNRNAANIKSQVANAASTTAMVQQVVNANTAPLFFGTAPGSGGGGALEIGAHGAIHMAVGQQNSPWTDMGILSTAARDPIFYAHHGNIDRMWWLWKQIPSGTTGNRVEPTSNDWLNTQFVFYNEKSQLVRVTVRDCIDIEGSMRITYEPRSPAWLSSGRALLEQIPQAAVEQQPNAMGHTTIDDRRHLLQATSSPDVVNATDSVNATAVAATGAPVIQGRKPVRTRAHRQQRPTSKTKRTVLSIQGLCVPFNQPAGYNIYIADASGAQSHVGQYWHVPRGVSDTSLVGNADNGTSVPGATIPPPAGSTFPPPPPSTSATLEAGATTSAALTGTTAAPDTAAPVGTITAATAVATSSASASSSSQPRDQGAFSQSVSSSFHSTNTTGRRLQGARKLMQAPEASTVPNKPTYYYNTQLGNYAVVYYSNGIVCYYFFTTRHSQCYKYHASASGTQGGYPRVPVSVSRAVARATNLGDACKLEDVIYNISPSLAALGLSNSSDGFPVVISPIQVPVLQQTYQAQEDATVPTNSSLPPSNVIPVTYQSVAVSAQP